MVLSTPSRRAPSVLKQSLITSSFILLWGIFYSLAGKNNSPDANESSGEPGAIDSADNPKTNIETPKPQDNKNRSWEQKFDGYINSKLDKNWKMPTKKRIAQFNVALSLFPTVIAAIGIALSTGNTTFLLLAYALYGIFALWVIASRATVASLVYEENDMKVWPIFLGIMVPAIVMGFVSVVLKDLPILNFFISLVLLARIAFISHQHLSLPLSYLQDAEKNGERKNATSSHSR